MATVVSNQNAQLVAQQEQVQVTAVAVAGTLVATVNGKTVTYVVVTGDTVTTATAAWLALLQNTATTPPEVQEATWSSTAFDTLRATATTPGTPFAGMTGGLVFSATGGCAVTQTSITANSSPSDVNNPKNWLRAGSPGLPQNGDDVVVADSGIPFLWNLDGLAAIQFASYVCWQTQEAAIGLPDINPAGYIEYRARSFKFVGPPAGTLSMVLGQGTAGSGPPRQRYDVGSQRTALTVLGAGSAAGKYAVTFLGSNANNTISLVGTSLGVAMGPAETATVASAVVDGGGLLAVGAGVTFSGALSALAGTVQLFAAPAALVLNNGSQGIIEAVGLTFAAVTARNGSQLTWNSNSTITALVLQTGSTLDKSGDVRPMTVTSSTVDGDSCRILDPNSTITYTNATLVNGQVSSGPFTSGPGRSWKLT